MKRFSTSTVKQCLCNTFFSIRVCCVMEHFLSISFAALSLLVICICNFGNTSFPLAFFFATVLTVKTLLESGQT